MKEQKKPYTVRYRIKGQRFWRTEKNIMSDYNLSPMTVDTKGKSCPCPYVRVLDNDKGERIEVPSDGTEFRFPKQRYRNLELDYNEDAKQKVF